MISKDSLFITLFWLRYALIPGLAMIALVGYAVYTVAWVSGQIHRWWWLHLVDYFRHIWPWIGVLVLAIMLYWQTPIVLVSDGIRHSATVMAAAVLSINLFISLRYGVGLQRLPQPFKGWLAPIASLNKLAAEKTALYWRDLTRPDTVIHVISLNLCHANHDYHRVRNFMSQQQADIVCVQEFTPDWVDALKDPAITALYPHQSIYSSAIKPDAGMAIFSRTPFVDGSEHVVEVSHSAIQRITLLWQDKPLHVMNFHPEATVTPYKFGRQKQHWRALRQLLDDEWNADEPLLIVGDFNVCPWSSMLAELREDYCLTDVQSDWGIQPTFPAPFPLVVIDNALGSQHWQWVDVSRGPWVGSDHFPLILHAHPLTANKVSGLPDAMGA